MSACISGGMGLSKVFTCFVTGWVNDKKNACRAWRGKFLMAVSADFPFKVLGTRPLEYKGSPIHSFFSSYISSADRMPNGNTLICEGSGGRIFEVTSNKQVVWEYVNPFSFPDARFGALTNATFRSHRYGPDHPALVGRDLDPARYGNLNRLHGTM